MFNELAKIEVQQRAVIQQINALKSERCALHHAGSYRTYSRMLVPNTKMDYCSYGIRHPLDDSTLFPASSPDGAGAGICASAVNAPLATTQDPGQSPPGVGRAEEAASVHGGRGRRRCEPASVSHQRPEGARHLNISNLLCQTLSRSLCNMTERDQSQKHTLCQMAHEEYELRYL